MSTTAVQIAAPQETVNAAIAQLAALADVISNIDAAKSWAPMELPALFAQAKQAVKLIWHNLLYPSAALDIEINMDQLDGFYRVIVCMQDAVADGTPELLPTFIETAHNLIEMMLGERAHLVYAPEDEV